MRPAALRRGLLDANSVGDGTGVDDTDGEDETGVGRCRFNQVDP
jgi:hypothetical protein